jgi:hypothetical protein
MNKDFFHVGVVLKPAEVNFRRVFKKLITYPRIWQK